MAIKHEPIKPRLPALLRVTGQVFEITVVDYPMFGPDGRPCTSMLVDGRTDNGPRRILISKNQTLTEQCRSLAYVVVKAELVDRGYSHTDAETMCALSDIVGNLIEANICR